ncbi:UNVERIFIED_CONTAM: TonB-dependent receptor, partial [Prevotella sp. 15_C9]
MNTGLALTQIENPNLKWETNYTLNIGIDYGLFNQRISGSIEYFYRGVKDLLDFQTLPSSNPVGRVAANIGETKSQGFEFSLRSDNLTSEK